MEFDKILKLNHQRDQRPGETMGDDKRLHVMKAQEDEKILKIGNNNMNRQEDVETLTATTTTPPSTGAVEKPNKPKQRQKRPGPANKRQHQDLASTNTRRLGGQVIMGKNRRSQLMPPFPPHPAKLTSIHQRRPRTKSCVPKSAASDGGAIRDAAHHDLQPQPQSQQQQQTQQLDQQGLVYICSGCQQPIRDRYLLSACDKYWHDNCLKCNRCQAKLGELGTSLYATGNVNLCRQDYYEMFGQKAICAVCDKLIYASEMVMRARDNVYHLECFACQLCGLRFCVGDRFYLCENKIVCQYDYDEHIYPIQYQQEQQQHQQQQQHPYGPPCNTMQTNFGSLDLQLPMAPLAMVGERVGDLLTFQAQGSYMESGPSLTIEQQQQQQQSSQAEPTGCNEGVVYHRLESSNDGYAPAPQDELNSTQADESRHLIDGSTATETAKEPETGTSTETGAEANESGQGVSVACGPEAKMPAVSVTEQCNEMEGADDAAVEGGTPQATTD